MPNKTESVESSTSNIKDIAGTPKPIRRGIGNATRGTTRLKFSTSDAKQNGLFLGHLESVEIKDIVIGEESTGMPSFNGLAIPKVVLTFASNDEDATKRKYVTLQFNAVESNADTIPGAKGEWKVNQIFDYFKHILNVYVLNGRAMTDEEEASLSLSFEDFDEHGQYVPVAAETVVAGWRSLFENFVTIMNTARDGQPVFKTKDGKSIAIWIKLLRYVKNTKKGWTPINNGDLAFPTFVGEGVIEKFKQNVPAAIRIDIIREDIKPKADVQPKTPNMPTAGIGSAPMFGGGVSMDAGIPAMDMMPGGIGLEAGQDDLPF